LKRQLTADQEGYRGTQSETWRSESESRGEAITKAVQVKRNGWDSQPGRAAVIYMGTLAIDQNETGAGIAEWSFSGGLNVQLWDHNKPYSYLAARARAAWVMALPSPLALRWRQRAAIAS